MANWKDSHAWQFMLGFLLGNAINTVAQDPSDAVFFWAGANGYLSTPGQQAFFYFWVPFVLWGALFLVGYGLARSGAKPEVALYVVVVVVAAGILFQLTLPDVRSPEWLASLILTSAVTAGILIGVRRHLKVSSQIG